MNFKGFVVGVYALLSLVFIIILMIIFKNKIPTIRKYWALSMIKIIGIDIEQIGTMNIDADIILLNHNSMLDILLLDYLHPNDIAWVTNKKLSKVPLYGLIFRLPNLILINPKKKSSINILLNRTKVEYQNNRPIGIFPEGTRGNTNDIKHFQKGAKIIIEKLNLKVQPIVILNSRSRLDTMKMKSSSGNVKIIYLDILESRKENWYKDLEESMKLTYSKYI
jgi:1-acyl-sn-glycerol-3-phosphate acyltransferase